MKTILQGKWGVDTNLVIYSFDRQSPYFEKTKAFLKFVNRNKFELYITQQNIIESQRVLIYTYKLPAKNIIADITAFIQAFEIKILSPLPSTLLRFHKLLQQTPQNDIFDVFLAATYLDNKVDQLFTMNAKDFAYISKFRAVNFHTLLK